MSIRIRLSLIYTGVLVFVFLFFSLVVYTRFKATLEGEIDADLEGVASAIIDRWQATVQEDETVSLFHPESMDVFQSATTFFMAVDKQGRILVSSENISEFHSLLDPNGITSEVSFRTVRHYAKAMRVFSAPLTITSGGQERVIGYLQVGRIMEGYDANLSSLRLTLLFAGWAAVALSLFLEDLFTTNLLKPLYDVTRLASHITKADDLSRRVPETGRNDEIGRLTTVLNDTLERLEQLFRAQQRLLADVSHELRTPLTAIRGNVDLIRRMGVADPESLDAILEETERMTRLVNDLLLLARADVGSLPLQREPVALDAILGEVYQQVNRLDYDVEIVIERLEPLRIMGDADRLKQLLLNLLNNAIKFTPDGGRITLGLWREGRHASIAVSDTGCGIPPEDLPHIFDRFYRVDKARARPNGGAGLGLSIVKWIVQAHDGRIDVESQLDEGTTFVVTLPALDGAAAGQTAVAGRHPTETETAPRTGLRPLGTGR